MTRAWLLAALGLGAACAPPEPPLPPLALAPARPVLEAHVRALPPPPDERRLAELRELVELAFSEAAHRTAAARARRRLDEDQAASLAFEQGLAAADPAVRAACAGALAARGAHGSLPLLCLRLRYEREPVVRGALALALARLGNGCGLEDLAMAMDDAGAAASTGDAALALVAGAGVAVSAAPTWAELQRALRALHARWLATGARLRPPEPDAEQQRWLAGRIAAHLLATDGVALRPVDEARFVLARLGQDALPLLAIALRAQETYLRQAALEIAAALGHAARPLAGDVLPLVQDPLSAPAALAALGALGDQAALPHVLARLGEASDELRTAAAGALGPLGALAALPALRRALREDASLDVRVHAAASLALLERGGPGRAFLEQRLAEGDYHQPTLRAMLERAGGGEARR